MTAGRLRFFFDNNFFWALCKDRSGEKVQRFNESLKANKIISGKTQAEALASPFTLLESIGSPHKKIPLPKPTPKAALEQSDKIEDLKQFLYEEAFKHYASQPTLSPAEVRKKVNEQRGYGTDFGKKLFEDVIAHNSDQEGFESSIYRALAFDFIQKYPFPSQLEDYAVASFLGDILRAPAHEFNVSWARIIGPAWRRTVNKLEESGDITSADRMKVEDNEYCFKTETDMVDTEVVHFATAGWYADGQMHPVVCFTSDRYPEKLKFRIGLYKLLANQGEQSLLEIEKRTGKKPPFKPIPLSAGTVAVCNHTTGEITELISAEELIKQGKLHI